MTTPLRVAPSWEGRPPDPELGRLIDDLARRLEAGEPLSEAAVLAAHPEHADSLRRLLPALFLLADLGRTVVPGGPARARGFAPLAEGEELGRFRIVRELGRGGMGVVYEALQLPVNRPVALKVVLAGEFAGAADLKRFRSEAEAVARLDHPSIVPVYEVGEERGRPYFAMKLCPGGSLDERLEGYRSDPRAAARVVAAVARALHHAHRRGILHRDLKPSNILLDAEGQPMVADFGLARLVDAEDDLTCTGDLLGSPPYMAPEQAAGLRGDVTIATDVYGLGAILYALLAGRPPFRGATPLQTLEQVRHREPDPPAVPDGRVDRDLGTVCLKCLEKDPRRRYESAAELADDLERWLRGEPILARPASLRHRLALWARRPDRVRDAGRFALALGTLLTLYAAVGLVLGGLGMLKVPRPAEFALFLAKYIAFVYLPVALVGLGTLRGLRRLIPVGLAQGLACSAILAAHLLGFFEVEAGGAFVGHAPVMVATYELLLLGLALLLALHYAVALAADLARRASRPAAPITPATLPAREPEDPR